MSSLSSALWASTKCLPVRGCQAVCTDWLSQCLQLGVYAAMDKLNLKLSKLRLEAAAHENIQTYFEDTQLTDGVIDDVGLGLP